MESQSRGHGGFIEVQEGNRAIAAGCRPRRRFLRDDRDAAVVAIVEENEGELAARVRGGERRAVLGVEPVEGIGVRSAIGVQKGEIALVAEVSDGMFPESPAPVVVVDFDEPILVTDGDDEVAVAGRIDDGVGVGPIRVQPIG